MQNASSWEARFFGHIAATSGDARGEFWNMTDLAKSWFGPGYVKLVTTREKLLRTLRLWTSDIRYAHPNVLVWWLLSGVMVVGVITWVYAR